MDSNNTHSRDSSSSTGLGIAMMMAPSSSSSHRQHQREARPRGPHSHSHSSSASSIPRISMPIPSPASAMSPSSASRRLRRPTSSIELGAVYNSTHNNESELGTSFNGGHPGSLLYHAPRMTIKETHVQNQHDSDERGGAIPWRQPSLRLGFTQGYQRIISNGSLGSPREGGPGGSRDQLLAGPRYEQQRSSIPTEEQKAQHEVNQHTRQQSAASSNSAGGGETNRRSIPNNITMPVPRPKRDDHLTTRPSPGDLMTPNNWTRRDSVWSPPTPSSYDRRPSIAAAVGTTTTTTTTNQIILPGQRYSRAPPLPWSNPHLSPSTAGSPRRDNRRSYGPGIAVQTPAGGSPYIPLMMNNHDQNGPYTGGSVKTTGSGNFPIRPEGRKRALSEGECQLHREGTLLTPHATSKRASAELSIMLGSKKSHKAKQSRLLPQGELPVEEKMAKLDKVKLEAGKGSKAKVEVDVVLENEEVVEGGEIRGRLEVRVRKAKKGEKVWIGNGKIRVVGYEEHSNTSARHIFYHYPYTLPCFTPYSTEEEYNNPLFASPPDEVGYRQAAEGNWVIPFSMRLPVNGGAKGGWSLGIGKPGVKYVVVGSIKLHTPESKKRAIAHFYRPCVVYPALEPNRTLAAQEIPRIVKAEGGLGWSLSGQKGKVTLEAKLMRDTWVAGQKVWIGVSAENMSSRKIRSFNLALLRTITIYSAPPSKGKTIDAWASPDLSLYKPNKTNKKLWEEVVEAPSSSTTGHLGSDSWWTGVEPGCSGSWQCSLTIPNDCVSVPRSRLLDVSYSIRITLNSAVTVDLPLTVVNFLSLDPPPGSMPPLTSTERAVGQAMPEIVTSQAQQPIDGQRRVSVVKAVDWAYKAPPATLETEFGDLQQGFAFPTMPKVRQGNARPVSVQTPMSDQFALGENKSREEASKAPSRPLSLARSVSSPSLFNRPGMAPRRDTTLSYLSAVESSDEDHDLALLEARRRAGRQQSLAAIMGNRIEGVEEEDEDAEEMETPPSQTFAPFKADMSPEARSEGEHLDEARGDLDFVRADEALETVEEEYDRDSESKHLEEDLRANGAYRSAMESTGGHSIAEHSGSEYPTTDGIPTPQTAPVPKFATTQEDSIYLDEDSSRTRGLPMDRATHVALSRTLNGSIAASAMSGESEVGQVVQAIRRDLSIKIPRKASEASSKIHSVGGSPHMNRLPFTSNYLSVPRANGMGSADMSGRSMSLGIPPISTKKRPDLSTRSNSLGVPLDESLGMPSDYMGTNMSRSTMSLGVPSHELNAAFDHQPRPQQSREYDRDRSRIADGLPPAAAELFARSMSLGGTTMYSTNRAPDGQPRMLSADDALAAGNAMSRSRSTEPPTHAHVAYRRPSAPPLLTGGLSPKTSYPQNQRLPGPYTNFTPTSYVRREKTPVSPKSYSLAPGVPSYSRRPSSPLARRMYSPIMESHHAEEIHGMGGSAPPGLAPSDNADSASSHESESSSPIFDDGRVQVRPDSHESQGYLPRPSPGEDGSAFELDDRSTYSRASKSPFDRSERFGSVTRISPSGPRSISGSPKNARQRGDHGQLFPLPPMRNEEGRTTYTAVFDARQRGERPDLLTGDRGSSLVPGHHHNVRRAGSKSSIRSTSTTATMAELALLHHAITSGQMEAPRPRRPEIAAKFDSGDSSEGLL